MDILERLKKIDTPTITNAVATYPAKTDTCLGLYHPTRGRWYSDQHLKCIYPEHGRRVGYVVTCVYGPKDPRYTRLGIMDVLRAIKNSPQPVILAVKQNFSEEEKDINGLMGGNMMTAFKAAGVVGVLSDGPSRDIDEIRPMDVQMMLTGVCAGHGDFAVEAVNVPVEICGMGLAPGEVVHMDENGAVKFQKEYMEEIAQRSEKILEVEVKRQKLMREADDVEEIGRIMNGFYD